jgi:hypothetical protein
MAPGYGTLYVNNEVKVSEQPLIINYGIPSKQTHLGGLRRFIALLTSAADMHRKKNICRDRKR